MNLFPLEEMGLELYVLPNIPRGLASLLSRR